MSVYVLWFDDGNTNKYIVGIFTTRESAHFTRSSYDEYNRACMSIAEEEVYV